MFSDQDLSSQDYQLNECRDHKGKPANLFCRNCSTPICNHCNSVSHRNHIAVPIEEKFREDQNSKQLKNFLYTGKRRATEAEERQEVIKELSKKIQESRLNVEQQVRKQYEHVKKELEETYKEEIEEINRRAEKELRKLTEESEELRAFGENWVDIEISGKTLLEQEGTSKFVNNIETFLQENKQTLPKDLHERRTKRIQYTEPIYKKTGEDKDFHMYLQEHLLGYVFPNHRQKTRSRKNSPLTSSPIRRKSPVASYQNSLVHSEIDARSSKSAFQQHQTSLGSIPPAPNVRAELLSHAVFGETEGLNLRRFHGANFMNNSIWICGLAREAGINYTTFYNVEVPDYNVLKKKQKSDPQGSQPTITCVFGQFILFAKKDGKELYSFDGRQFSKMNLKAPIVTDMCFSNKYIYIFDGRRAHEITFFEPHSNRSGKIKTEFTNIDKCDIHMCVILDQATYHVAGSPNPQKSADQQEVTNETVVLSSSRPHACVRAVHQKRGVLWQLDCTTHPELIDLTFNPCSVSASEAGDVFIADRGSDKVNNKAVFYYLKKIPLFWHSTIYCQIILNINFRFILFPKTGRT